jgi:hypothetical protein
VLLNSVAVAVAPPVIENWPPLTVSLFGTNMSRIKSPEVAGEDVKPIGLSWFCAIGEFVPSSTQAVMAVEPHQPCSVGALIFGVADAGRASPMVAAASTAPATIPNFDIESPF